MSDARLTQSHEEAAIAASKFSGMHVGVAHIRRLIELGLLQAVGENGLLVLEYQVRMLGCAIERVSDFLFDQEFRAVCSRVEVRGQTVLPLSRNLLVFFAPGKAPPWVLRAFIGLLRQRSSQDQPLLTQHIFTVVNKHCSVWGNANISGEEAQSLFTHLLARDARTSPAESQSVPSIYGNKARLTDFVVSTIRQWLPPGQPICDLMAGTGLVTRQLLKTYPVYANDAALFASCLARSQAIAVTESEVKTMLCSVEEAYSEHYALLYDIFHSAIIKEQSLLFGGLSSQHLRRYADFCNACTHFVPDAMKNGVSEVWTPTDDNALRTSVAEFVLERRRDNDRVPFLLASSYWSNCYFGVRQAVEVDSLCYAIRQRASGTAIDLMQAVLLAAVEVCSSGPHFAQPPTMQADQQIRRVIDKRLQSVMAEFKSRMFTVPLRPVQTSRSLAVTQLAWSDALHKFSESTKASMHRAVYIDPPYSRLQYSRFYHVFDTLLRYDYPQSIGVGRVSELSKRASSRFDSRMSSALSEIEAVVQHVSSMQATLFLSYATGGTVPLEKIHKCISSVYKEVVVVTEQVQHHSQGRRAGASVKAEVVFVGLP